MSVLITGMGVVGVAAARKFAEEGYKVLLYHLRPREPPDFIREMKDKVTIVLGDIIDYAKILECIRKYDVKAIIHTALPPIDESYFSPNKTFKETIEANKNMLEMSRIFDLQYITLSSGAVYGPRGMEEAMKEEDPAPSSWPAYLGDGDDPLTRYQIYVYTKRCMEIMAEAYHAMYGVDSFAIRTHFVYGPFDTKGFFIQPCLEKVIRGQPVIVYGGDFKTDYTYSKDLADGLFRCLTVKPRPRHRLFNISGGKLYSRYEVVDAIRKAVPSAHIEVLPGLAYYGPEPTTEKGRYRHMRGYLDISRARAELGYEPTPLEQGIKEYAEWLKRQQTL